MSIYLKVAMFIFLIQILIHQGYGYLWEYSHQEKWGQLSSICDTGKQQSPIDLRATERHKSTGNPTITFENLDAVPLKSVLHNTGLFLELNNTWSDKKPVFTSTVIFPNEKFGLDNIYFHMESDHAMEGKKYPLEVVFVYHNVKYPNLTGSVAQPHGILIMPMLFDVDDSKPANPGVAAVALHLNDVSSPDGRIVMDKVDASQFLPNPIGPYYAYIGSIPIPLCNENMQYVVPATIQPITSDIRKAFSNIKFANGATSDFRNLQKSNSRVIDYYEQ